MYALQITTNLCLSCGHRWTSSSLVQRVAASSFSYSINSRKEPLRDQITCLFHTNLTAPACFRCVDPALPSQWPTFEAFETSNPLPIMELKTNGKSKKVSPRSVAPISDDDLAALLEDLASPKG